MLELGIFLAVILGFFYIFDVRSRLSALDRRLSALERKLSGASPFESDSTEPLTDVSSAAARAANPEPVASSTTSRFKPWESGGGDLETLIGGRWLNYVAVIALIFGAAFFLKLAFENEWIGEKVRILIGVLCGAFLLAYSQRLLDRGYRFFSESIAGLGAGVLYLSLYAGWGFYRLFPQTFAFVGLVGVSALMVALALKRDSERIGVIALLGAFLTPMLLSSGVDQQFVLFTYLLLLNTSLLALAWARRWRNLDLLSFLGTQLLFWGWYSTFYNDSKLASTLVFASIFFLQFATVPPIRNLQREKISGDQVFLILANAFWFLVALSEMLWRQHRLGLALALAGLACGHSVVAQTLASPARKLPPATSLLYGGLALTFATLIVPVLVEGKWMTIAWAVEGLVLVRSGLYIDSRLLRWSGLLLFFLVVLRLAAFPIAAGSFLVNARFLTFLVTVLCFAFALSAVRGSRELRNESERMLIVGLGVAANVLALWALSMELWDLFGKREVTFGVDRKLAQQLALSLLWTFYAIGLMLSGVLWKAIGLRWQALVLFGVVVAKVFFYDLSFLQQFYRVLSFVVLGLALLLTSFLYHRRVLSDRPEEKS